MNGRRIRGETVLTAGDIVKIGRLNLEIVIGTSAAGEAVPPAGANMDTTANATALDTAHEMPKPMTLEDSGMLVASPNDSTQFELPIAPVPGELNSGESTVESETVLEESTVYQPVEQAAPAPPAQAPPQPGMPPADPQNPQGNWQYPQQYFPPQPYQQYPAAGYPMGYPPPGYPPGYGYPPQQGYPPDYQQQMPQQPLSEQPPSDAQIPEVRLPDPADTGAREEPPKPAAENQEAKPDANESTPSQSAADMINSARRRRRTEE